MKPSADRSSLSRRVLRAVSALRSMVWKRIFRSSIYESVRPVVSSRYSWLETLSNLIGKGSNSLHQGGAVKVSAKERAKRAAAREFRRRVVMAEQLELRALMAADLGLDPTKNLVSDSALVSTLPGQSQQALDQGSNLQASDSSMLSASQRTKLMDAVSQVNSTLRGLVQDGRFANVATQAFELENNPDSLGKIDLVSNQILKGSLGLTVELRSAQELRGVQAAYAAHGESGQEQIYLSKDWLSGASNSTLVATALLEEVGHALDVRFNGDNDSRGDEGHIFASLSLRTKEDLTSSRNTDDHFTMVIDGKTISAEHAAGTIVQQVFVPMRETDIYNSLRAINSTVGNTIWSVVSITATSDGTTV